MTEHICISGEAEGEEELMALGGYFVERGMCSGCALNLCTNLVPSLAAGVFTSPSQLEEYLDSKKRLALKAFTNYLEKNNAQKPIH